MYIWRIHSLTDNIVFSANVNCKTVSSLKCKNHHHHYHHHPVSGYWAHTCTSHQHNIYISNTNASHQNIHSLCIFIYIYTDIHAKETNQRPSKYLIMFVLFYCKCVYRIMCVFLYIYIIYVYKTHCVWLAKRFFRIFFPFFPSIHFDMNLFGFN